jgi:thiol-disulfide isomerase/thioredoxin
VLVSAHHSHPLHACFLPSLGRAGRSWCPHCKSFAPKFDKIARALARDRTPISCAKIDATENPLSARRFSVRSFPALRLLKGGRMWEYPSDKPRTVADIVDFVKGGYAKLDSVPVPGPVTMFTQLQEELLQAVTEAADIAVSKPNPAMVLSAAGFIVGMLCTTIVALGTACLLPVDGEAQPSNDAAAPVAASPADAGPTPNKSARKRAAARAKATIEAQGSK